jgi:uncharacterized protein
MRATRASIGDWNAPPRASAQGQQQRPPQHPHLAPRRPAPGLRGLARAPPRARHLCPAQLDEIRRASRHPGLRGLLQPHRAGAVVNALAAGALPDPPPRGHEADDPDDARLPAPAEASGADRPVTGDRRSGLLARGRAGRARIVTVAAFCGLALRRARRRRAAGPRAPSPGPRPRAGPAGGCHGCWCVGRGEALCRNTRRNRATALRARRNPGATRGA